MFLEGTISGISTELSGGDFAAESSAGPTGKLGLGYYYEPGCFSDLLVEAYAGAMIG